MIQKIHSSDYDAIRSQNIRGYGEYTHHLGFLGQLYSDRTHFIFELLQNAEDAGAEEISFELYKDRLEVHHDGRRFNDEDVRGICGVGESKKSEDLNQIGKFGIGFKSVCAYTTSPTIHSGNEHFRIEDYVRPYSAPPKAMGSRTTLFVFPFNHRSVSADEAFSEISNRLGNLNVRTLLFLRRVARISWSVEGKSAGVYEQIETDPIQQCPRIRLAVRLVEADHSVQTYDEEWLIFDRPVRHPSVDTQLRVEVAFKLGEDSRTGQPVIVRAEETDLVVSFPTEKKTHLGFLIQGPYQTTPARDNIPSDVEWNNQLVQETANLVVSTLPVLRDAGLLTLGLLDAMPIRVADFPVGSMFRPIYDAVRNVLRSETLLPRDGGGYTSARSAKLARGAALIDLLSPEQLGVMMERSCALHWLDRDITHERMPALYRYLVGYSPLVRDEAEAIEPLVKELLVDAETVAKRLTGEFIATQSDEWLVKLYRFLGEQRGIWAIIKSRPILRLQDRSHAPPFDRDGRPTAYLPPPTPTVTRFPIVHREIAKDKDAREFLERLGLTEPDPATGIVESILPKYDLLTDIDAISIEEHQEDLEKICDVLGRLTESSRHQFLTRLHNTPFLRAENAHTGEVTHLRPGEIYLRTPALSLYFQGNRDIWFLDERLFPAPELLADLGVLDTVQIKKKSADRYGYVVIRSRDRDHVRGLQGFDPSCEIVGLAHALSHITLEKAGFIWNELLIPNRHMVRGVVETSRYQSYLNAEQEEVFSAMGTSLGNASWLPSLTGEFHRPCELSPEELPERFVRDDELGSTLGMQIAELEAAAYVTGFSVAELQLLRSHVNEVKALVNRLREQQRERKPGVTVDAREVETVNFSGALTQEFMRPGHVVLIDESPIRDDEIPDASLRQDRVRAEIAAEQHRGALTQHFTRVPRSKWESKNSKTREFLKQEYGGHCQICRDTFPKADGEAYFEGLYLVPRIKAIWLDRPGNVLSLCPTCCAKLQFGSVEADGIVNQIEAIRFPGDRGERELALNIMLLGVDTEIRFTERHMLDLQEMIRASS